MSDSVRPYGLQPARLLCPWDSLEAGVLELVAMPSSRGSSPPRDRTYVSYIDLWVKPKFTHTQYIYTHTPFFTNELSGKHPYIYTHIYIHVHTFVQIHWLYNTKSESECKLLDIGWTWCQYRIINCNNCTTLMGDDDNGGGYAPVEARGIWRTSVPSSQLCCELETAL